MEGIVLLQKEYFYFIASYIYVRYIATLISYMEQEEHITQVTTGTLNVQIATHVYRCRV